MPFYDFRCDRCDAIEEFLLPIDAPGPAIHDGCGGALERVYAPASIHFKGSGWAKLDRRDSGPSTGSTAGSTTGSTTETRATPSAASSSTPKPSGE